MTTNRNLQPLALFLENDEHLKNCLLKKIEECIQTPVNAKTSRRVTAIEIFELSLLEKPDREKKIFRIKELEILDIFLAKNHIFLEDREKIESYPNLSTAIVRMYSKDTSYERIKRFFAQEKTELLKLAERAEELRKRYLTKHADSSNEKDILLALRFAPLGSEIMIETLYDLYQNKIGVGILGEGLTLEDLKKINADLEKAVTAVNPVDLVPKVPSSISEEIQS